MGGPTLDSTTPGAWAGLPWGGTTLGRTAGSPSPVACGLWDGNVMFPTVLTKWRNMKPQLPNPDLLPSCNVRPRLYEIHIVAA